MAFTNIIHTFLGCLAVGQLALTQSACSGALGNDGEGMAGAAEADAVDNGSSREANGATQTEQDADLPGGNKTSSSSPSGDNSQADSASDSTASTVATGSPIQCSDAATEPLSLAPLRRLSSVQYQNTLRDLFEPIGLDVEEQAASELRRIPTDDSSLGFSILDSRVSDQHVGAYYRIADRLASIVSSDSTLASALGGECTQDSTLSAECVDALLDDFGMRVLRRPLATEERSSFQDLASGSATNQEALRAVVFKLLLSPELLYHIETEGEGNDDRFSLGPYELASRLSYHFWQTLPDAELFAAAEDGSLLTEDGFAEQLERVFEHPRTQLAIDRFYDEWLHLGWLTEFPKTPVFEAFAQGTTIFDTDADHIAAAQEEIHALTRYFTFENQGSLSDLYLTDLSFTQSPHLAELYGVVPWDGTGEPPQMPSGQRAGLLTRVAFLLTGNHETHPIHRGAVIRRRVLCEDLPTPDPAALPPGALEPPPITQDQTTRQRYEEKTQDATCSGCHSLINPPGFVLEQYDALGRYRGEEQVFDTDTGDVLVSLPVDSMATLQLGQQAREVHTGRELSEEIVASGKAENCFARNYFRMALAREENDDDACAIQAIEQALTNQGSLREALKTIALTPVFQSRRVR